MEIFVISHIDFSAREDYHYFTVKIWYPLSRRMERRKCMRFYQLMNWRSRRGMELVQVAILVAIAIALGLIFKTQITDFVNKTFAGLKQFN